MAGGGAALALRDHFLAGGLDRGALVVAGYWPIRSEIDPRPLMRALLGRGGRLSLPVIEGEGLPLTFREWTPGAVMEPGPYGAEVPKGGAWLRPDLLLVPLLAFDAGGRRLGYGGGFYDRTLGELRATRPDGTLPLRAIGLGFAAQQMKAVPTEETDQPLDAVVTEEGVLRMCEGIS